MDFLKKYNRQRDPYNYWHAYSISTPPPLRKEKMVETNKINQYKKAVIHSPQ